MRCYTVTGALKKKKKKIEREIIPHRRQEMGNVGY